MSLRLFSHHNAHRAKHPASRNARVDLNLPDATLERQKEALKQQREIKGINREDSVLIEFLEDSHKNVTKTILNGAGIGFATGGALSLLLFGPASTMLNNIQSIRNIRAKRKETLKKVLTSFQDFMKTKTQKSLNKTMKNFGKTAVNVLLWGVEPLKKPYLASVPLTMLKTGAFGALAGGFLSLHLLRKQRARTEKARVAIRQNELEHRRRHPHYKHKEYFIQDTHTHERKLKHVAVMSDDYDHWRSNIRSISKIFYSSLAFNFGITTGLLALQGISLSVLMKALESESKSVKNVLDKSASFVQNNAFLKKSMENIMPEQEALLRRLNNEHDEEAVHDALQDEVNLNYFYAIASKLFSPINIFRLATLGLITSLALSIRNAQQIYKAEDKVGYKPVKTREQLDKIIKQQPLSVSAIVSRNRGAHGDFYQAVQNLHTQLHLENIPLELTRYGVQQ